MASRALATLLLTALAATMTGCGPSAEPPPGEAADLVLVNGKIVTLDDARPEAAALAAKDGRIVAVGSREDVEAWIGESTEVLDLAGHLAIPGFIEGHGHFLGLGDSKLQLDLRAPATWDEIVALVAQAVADAEPGEWIRGRGWHQDKWDAVPAPAVEGFPIHDALSAVSPDNPVVLGHASGHAVFVNAKAMELAGIDASTPDPEGGEILRDARGRPTGLLRETAEDLVAAVQPAEPTPAEVRRRVELASAECLAKGVTSFQDAGSSFAAIDALKQAADDGTLGVRLWIMVRGSEDDLDARLPLYRTDDYAGHRLAVGGIKVWMDGALGSRGAWLLEPYADSAESSGLNTFPLEETRRLAGLAIEHGYQLCIHAIGDRANREVLDVYEETFAAHPDASDLRWRIEHAQHVDPADVPRFAELGVIAAMQGVHCTSDGPWVPDRLGEERAAATSYVWRTLLDAGATIANGTDAPVEDVSPVASFHASVTRRMAGGEAFHPEQAMTRQEALASYTLGAAYAVFQEDVKGSLEAGKLADVTVLSRDILEVPADEIPGTEVLYTIVGGEVAYRRP
jgi:hypothetical protein